MYLVFTRMPGEIYCRQLRSLLLCLCYRFQALLNFLMCWFIIGKINGFHQLINSLRRKGGGRGGGPGHLGCLSLWRSFADSMVFVGVRCSCSFQAACGNQANVSGFCLQHGLKVAIELVVQFICI